MIFAECQVLRADLESFADDELTGASRLRVVEHLEFCERCRARVDEITEVGRVLRGLPVSDLPSEIDGMASRVVSRVGAETAQSWHRLAERAFDGWHWTVVGVGSVASTFVVTSFLAFLLAFGPGPERADSLSALITNLGSSPGVLFVYATPSPGGDSVVMQVDNGQPQPDKFTAGLAEASGYRMPTEREMVGALADAMTRGGRVVPLESLNREDRLYAEALLNGLTRLRWSGTTSGAGRVVVHEVRLVTGMSVTAKGL